MVKISVDEAYAFDMLAISEIKRGGKSAIPQPLSVLVGELVNQLGQELFETVTDSAEYKHLHNANLYTFNLIETLRRKDYVSPKKIDDANMMRFRAKEALQKKFFGTELTEIKTTGE